MRVTTRIERILVVLDSRARTYSAGPASRRAGLHALVALATLGGCSLVGLGRIQPADVEGSWTFRSAGGQAACGVDSVSVRLRDGDRTWGSFFISGEGVAAGPPGQPLQISHGRVHPKSGNFLLSFSDHESPPQRTQSFELQGTFDDSAGAVADFLRFKPGPECTQRMVGRRRR